MNKIYRNLIRYVLIFMAMFSISAFADLKMENWGYAMIVVLAFSIGFMLSQSIKDIEESLDAKS